MGGNPSKPLRDSARVVLARRQIPTPTDVPVPPQITPSIQHADIPHVATPPPSNENPVHHLPTSSVSSNVPSDAHLHDPNVTPGPSSSAPSNEFNPSAAPLPPDLLAAISKWQVRKNVASSPSGNVPNSIEPVRFRSVVSIRQQKDLEVAKREEQGLPLIGRLTEPQIHDLYKLVRDHPEIDAVEIAVQFHLTENMAQLLLDVARLPVIVKSDDETESLAI